MSERMFDPGDTVTDGIVTKRIVSIKGDHYLTNVGVIPFEKENQWKLVAKKGDQK